MAYFRLYLLLENMSKTKANNKHNRNNITTVH